MYLTKKSIPITTSWVVEYQFPSPLLSDKRKEMKMIERLIERTAIELAPPTVYPYYDKVRMSLLVLKPRKKKKLDKTRNTMGRLSQESEGS